MFIYSKVDTNHLQVFNQLSIRNSINLFPGDGFVIFIEEGYQNFTNYNSSKNYVRACPGLVLRSHNPMNLIFITVSNNRNRNHHNIVFTWYITTCLMNFSNIINNDSGTTSVLGQTIAIDQLITTITNTIFYNNSDSQLFRVASGTLNIINCKSNKNDYSGTIFISSNFEIILNSIIPTIIFNNYYNQNCLNNNIKFSCLINNYKQKYLFLLINLIS